MSKPNTMHCPKCKEIMEIDSNKKDRTEFECYCTECKEYVTIMFTPITVEERLERSKLK